MPEVRKIILDSRQLTWVGSNKLTTPVPVRTYVADLAARPGPALGQVRRACPIEGHENLRLSLNRARQLASLFFPSRLSSRGHLRASWARSTCMTTTNSPKFSDLIALRGVLVGAGRSRLAHANATRQVIREPYREPFTVQWWQRLSRIGKRSVTIKLPQSAHAPSLSCSPRERVVARKTACSNEICDEGIIAR